MAENQIQPIQNTTFVPDIRPDLSEYSSDELVSLYVDIDQQTQLYKGTILLEARKRLPSNIEFGEWCISVQTLCLDSQKSMNRYMHLAAYFQNKDMEGISLSVGYEISSPQNAGIADAVYEKALSQDLSIAEAKELIQEEKLAAGIPVKIQKDSSVVETIPNSESMILNLSLDEGEFKFKQNLKNFIDKYALDVNSLLIILDDYYECASKTKPSILRLYDILELIEYEEQCDDDILDERDHQELPEDLGTPEPLHSSVSLQVPGTNHKQHRNDLCACGSGLKYKKCCCASNLGIVTEN